MAKAQKYIGEETPQRKNLYLYFLDGGNYWDGEIRFTGRGAPNIICCVGGGTIGEGTPRNNGRKAIPVGGLVNDFIT